MIEKRPAERVDFLNADEATFAKAQITDDDVFAYGEVWKQIQFLIDDADTETLRVERAGDRRWFAIDKNRSRIGPTDPAMILASVLLPAPFSPISAWTSPARSVKCALLRADTPP